MLSPLILLAILYLIAGIGFAKTWATAANYSDSDMKIVCCIFWPAGLFISAFWSW
ncbi:hypothetical protein [Klebsiella michiganensis]|uniref:hypothetical protein n=1 Tax=Klebsiella/Raoultella group TaxID=2890311 RepID=UPI001F14EA63|nr:hypothetical protein [Klebsiella michiganensis]